MKSVFLLPVDSEVLKSTSGTTEDEKAREPARRFVKKQALISDRKKITAC